MPRPVVSDGASGVVDAFVSPDVDESVFVSDPDVAVVDDDALGDEELDDEVLDDEPLDELVDEELVDPADPDPDVPD